MLHRQHHTDGNKQLIAQMKLHLKYPTSSNKTKQFEDLIYLNQIIQTMCIKAESEHYRRMKAEKQMTMGLMYWQLNDVWQAPTWSSIEYGGRWKMLHYASRRFYENVLISAFEKTKDTLTVHVTSDLLEDMSGTVFFTLWDWNGKVIDKFTKPFTVKAQWSTAVYTTSITQLIKGRTRQECLLTYDFGKPTDDVGFFFFGNLTDVNMPMPEFTTSSFTQVDTKTILFKVKSTELSPWTWFETPYQGVYSDNGILLLPNVVKDIVFRSSSSITVSQLQSSLKIRSVRQTY